MKRALALAAMLASAAAMSTPALAAGVPQYGSVKLQWNVAVTMNALIHTNYTAAFANGGASATLLGNPGAGQCGVGTGQADFNLDYGTMTPLSAAEAACTYKNAVAASVQTNDNSGFKVNEYLDAAPPGGSTICAYPNGGAAFPLTAGALGTSARSGVGPAVFSGACDVGGAIVTQGTGGALVNAGAGGSQVAGAGEQYTAPTGGAFTWISNVAAAGVPVFGGEDLQLNLPANAGSGAASVVMTVQFIPN
ncbi:MAG: hypothetical protein ABI182_03850 [Candidatus Baltobacteraceae bacterium]